MAEDEMIEKVMTIANHFGLEHQKLKTIEECNELIQAIKNNDEENIKEEMADVLIMIFQLIYLMGVDLEEIISFKLARTIKRYNAYPNYK